MQSTMHAYEVRPRKDNRGVDLISDVLPFGRLWYGEPNAIVNATQEEVNSVALRHALRAPGVQALCPKSE
jgi:hypothetical protein